VNTKSQLLDVPFCKHPEPELCRRLGRHLWGSTYMLYKNNPEYRAFWEAEAPFRLGKADPGDSPPGERLIPCRYKLDVLQMCRRRPGGYYDIYACELHDKCSPRYVSNDVQACCLCTEYQPGQVPIEWITTEQLVRDTISFAGRLPVNLAGVAGVPRSGMIPASVLATQLHLPLIECSLEKGFYLLGKGGRGYITRSLAEPLLVIDDTVYMGSQMDKLRPLFTDRNILTGAIYVHQGSTAKVDLYHKEVPWLTQFQWNCTNNATMSGFGYKPGLKGGIGSDLDGILCHDAESGGKPGSLYFTMRRDPSPLICTGRTEKARAETIWALKQMGVQYQALEMRPIGMDDTPAAIANLKAAKCLQYQVGAFIESDAWQAAEIADLTALPVICPRLGKVFQRSSAKPPLKPPVPRPGQR
jgi:hypothetical protein